MARSTAKKAAEAAEISAEEKIVTEAAETGTEEELNTAETGAEPNGKEEAKTEVFAEKTIYIGPNIAKYGLTKNAVYALGAPYPSEAVRKIPAVKKLLIPVKDFTPTTPGNLRLYYNRAAEKAKEI